MREDAENHLSQLSIPTYFADMSSTLRYGNDSRVEFDLPDEVLLAECGSPQIASDWRYCGSDGG